MSTITFEGYLPPPRYDGEPWLTVIIEEAPASTGSWTQIDERPLAPVDPDPENPLARDVTTDNATLAGGWYRVVWRDAALNRSDPSAPIENRDDRWFPSTNEVARHIRYRTRSARNGALLGYFTADTSPTADDVRDYIDDASQDVLSETGRIIPDEVIAPVQALVSLRAAMLVERGHFPEQLATDRSAYAALERDWERRLPQVVEAVKEAIDLGRVIPGDPDATTPAGPGDPGPAVPTDSDHVVPAGSRVLTKSGVWLGSNTTVDSFPDDEGGMIGYNTKL